MLWFATLFEAIWLSIGVALGWEPWVLTLTMLCFVICLAQAIANEVRR